MSLLCLRNQQRVVYKSLKRRIYVNSHLALRKVDVNPSLSTKTTILNLAMKTKKNNVVLSRTFLCKKKLEQAFCPVLTANHEFICFLAKFD